MNGLKITKQWLDKWQKHSKERMEPLISSLGKEGDREAAIISVCVLDDLLEELLRTCFAITHSN